MHFSEFRHRGKSLNSFSTATTNVEDDVTVSDPDVF
jgi:hypothetical protein